MRILLLMLFSVLAFTSCQKSATSASPGEVKRFDFKGKVVSVDRERKRATIDHEAVVGYMGAMTMEFPIHEDWVWNDLTPGSEIRAELVVDNTAKEPYFLDKIGIVANAKP